jgi:putative transcriptional regulator
MSPVKRSDGGPIYNRLPTLRAERALSRAELAHMVGLNPQTIGALERGDHYPSLDLAMRLCEVFGLPVEAIFSRAPFIPLSDQIYRAQGGQG